jgi:hypothetical protein
MKDKLPGIRKRTSAVQTGAATAQEGHDILIADVPVADSARQTAQSGSASYDVSAALTAVEPPVIDNHSSLGSPAFYRAEDNKANPQNQTWDRTSHPTSADEFWDEAYDKLKGQDSELIMAYEEILSHDYEFGSDAKGADKNLIEQNGRPKRSSQMDRILQKVLDKTTKPNGVGKVFEDAINVFLSLKDAIGFGLQPVPIAALAWTGVCMDLQVNYLPTVLTTYLCP